MTRRRMLEQIRTRLEDYDLPINEDTKAVADAAVDCALEYVLEFAVSMAEELILDHETLSGAMTAGVIVNKIKRLMGE